jgi:hypothetical protein
LYELFVSQGVSHTARVLVDQVRAVGFGLERKKRWKNIVAGGPVLDIPGRSVRAIYLGERRNENIFSRRQRNVQGFKPFNSKY